MIPNDSKENLDEYEDPLEYDAEYGEKEPEFSFYLDLAKKQGGEILDVACGTGRIAIPLAEKGFEVTGIDISPDMIKRAYEKSVNLPVAWLVTDCRKFELSKKFQLIIMAGNSFQAMLTRRDQEMFFASVRSHLHPDGFFAFDTRQPLLKRLSEEEPKEEFWHEYINAKGNKTKVFGIEEYLPLTETSLFTTRRVWQEGGTEKIKETKITLRYTFPEELETLLHYNGFSIDAIYGNWDRKPLTPADEKMILVCHLS